MKKPLIVIAGPTASGKTSIAISLAKKIAGEILSADSMQVYKGMDIGTAKPSLEEMQGIKHYLIDCVSPCFEFNVSEFQKMAKKAMEEIWAKGKIPIIVGGTGFYINALIYDNDFTPLENDFSYRKELYALAEQEGAEALYEKLKEIDPDYAATTHSNNVKRVSRALEYYHLTGEKFSDHNKIQKQKESPYNTAMIILHMDRQVLYDRIDQRVDKMMSEGLLEEVEGLLKNGCHEALISMQGLGYKEFFPYFKGEITLPEAVSTLKQSTRRFAKRQLTWFRAQTSGLWLDRGLESEEASLIKISDYLSENKIRGDRNNETIR